MTHKIHASPRRILTFPAVHPCDAVAPATLLASLVNLATTICGYKSKFFAANKRNTRELIRQIGILLVFLEEILDRRLDLPASAVLSFSELRVTLQKIVYLLEDCSFGGARLLMLMKSERVSNHLRILIRATATALDVLPLELIDVSDEVKESVELTMRQARRVRFEVEADDERASKDVLLILDGFEDGVVPDRGDIRRVLDYVGIRSWSECNKEVKFLDTELGLEWSNMEKREVAFLSSLMGFMSYCRFALFDVVDGEAGQQLDKECSSDVLNCLNPDDFRCPITLELMTDPVTIETGHTYERSSILKWFRAGNPICPKTGEKVVSMDVVPNMALQRLIQQYCSANGIPISEPGHRNHDITRTVLAGSLAAEGAMKVMANFLAGRLAAGTSGERNKAAYEIRLLAKTNIFNRYCLAEAGTIPRLLHLLSSGDSSSQHNAIAALLNLSKYSKSKTIMAENGGLELIVGVLRKGLKIEVRELAAATLYYLASVEEYRKLIGEIPEAFPALLELIKTRTDRGKKNALVAIFGLLTFPDNHWRVLASGAVPLLVNLLTSSEREDLVTASLAVLATLAEKLDGTITILGTGALHLILQILNSSPSRPGIEYCVSLLLALCINGGKEVVSVLVKNPSLMGSLYSLLTEDNSRASKKARSLIRILHEFCERRASGLVTPAFPEERYVDVW